MLCSQILEQCAVFNSIKPNQIKLKVPPYLLSHINSLVYDSCQLRKLFYPRNQVGGSVIRLRLLLASVTRRIPRVLLAVLGNESFTTSQAWRVIRQRVIIFTCVFFQDESFSEEEVRNGISESMYYKKKTENESESDDDRIIEEREIRLLVSL